MRLSPIVDKKFSVDRIQSLYPKHAMDVVVDLILNNFELFR